MHLINAKTYRLEYFVGAGIPPYVILSHVWGTEEVLFQDLQQLKSARKKGGFMKIHSLCQQALQDGLHYAWVDTCCINKESSAELSEAINSMFNWYRRAKQCYAYLSDLKLVTETCESVATEPSFAESRWFTRGWTLQELIAPSDVTFVDQNWATIGTKKGNLLEEISRVTNIDKDVLTSSHLMFRRSIAKRMSWAAKRKTTRKEDEAYCLLGLFNVNMPMLYGEEEGAFTRLQEILIGKTSDQSVFVHDNKHCNLLALSPQDFDGYGDVMTCGSISADKSYELTNVGLRITLPVLAFDEWEVWAILSCHRNHRRFVLRLQRRSGENSKTLFPMKNPRVQLTELETLLQCPVEELLIARYQDYLPVPETDPFLTGMHIARLWLYPAHRAGGLEINICALEPLKFWDVAMPVDEKLGSNIRSSERLAYFNLRYDFEEVHNAGAITFNAMDGFFKLASLRLHFDIRPERTQGIPTCFYCDLDLRESDRSSSDGARPSGDDTRVSITDPWLEPGSRMQFLLSESDRSSSDSARPSGDDTRVSITDQRLEPGSRMQFLLSESDRSSSDSARPSGDDTRVSITDQRLEPGSRVQVLLSVKQLRLTAALELVPGYSGSFGMVGLNFVLHLRASKADGDSAVYDEAFDYDLITRLTNLRDVTRLTNLRDGDSEVYDEAFFDDLQTRISNLRR